MSVIGDWFSTSLSVVDNWDEMYTEGVYNCYEKMSKCKSVPSKGIQHTICVRHQTGEGHGWS